MKATDLVGVLRSFSTRGPLTGAQLEHWFVERNRSPRGRLKTSLQFQQQPQKILFIGHRGSGKSTELNKLAQELTAHFFTIGFGVLDVTGRTNLDYEDLMLAISTQVTKQCIDAALINQPLLDPVRQRWSDLLDWWERIVAGQRFSPPGEAELGAKFNLLLLELEAGVRQSSETRQAIKDQISLRMPELIRHLNWVLRQAEESTGKSLLLIVEELDKVNLESATNIFLNQAATLLAPEATIIYTFPVALRYSGDFRNILANFRDNMQALPNIAPHQPDGKLDQHGYTILHNLVLNRMEEALIQPEALRRLIPASGGIPTALTFLIENAALTALTRDEHADRITLEDANSAIIRLREQLIPPLTEEDWQVLRERHQDHRLTSDDDNQDLLNKGALIEYPGAAGQPWCDAHPILWDLLQE
jgi:hypothetical protein